MAEYIERVALMEQVKAIHRAVNTADRNISYDTGFHSATSQIQGLIAWMPAADVVEVKRGEWLDGMGMRVPFDENDGCPAYSCYCSACGEWLVASDEYPCFGNFCPKCGADMRGNNNDNRTEN
jgi:hypothetical protein